MKRAVAVAMEVVLAAAVMVAKEWCWREFWRGMLVVMMEVTEVMVMENRSLVGMVVMEIVVVVVV